METSDSGKNSDWLYAPTCTTGNQYFLPTLSHIGETALKSESRRLLKMFRFRVAIKVFFDNMSDLCTNCDGFSAWLFSIN